jgi:thiol:disulfide interchange protein
VTRPCRWLGVAAALAVLTAGTAGARIFDPTLDPVFQLAAARKLAIREHKNILLDLGGDWCVFCLVLDRALHSDRALAAHYVLVHVNVSPENPNRSFLAHYPAPTGYPFLIILAPDGKTILHVQNGAEFQKGKSADSGYEHESVRRFLERWARPS